MVLGCWRSPLSLVFTRRKSTCLRTRTNALHSGDHLPPQPRYVCLSTCLASQPAICRSSHPFVYLSLTHPFICLSIKSFTHTSVHLSRHPPDSVCTRLYIGLLSIQWEDEYAKSQVGGQGRCRKTSKTSHGNTTEDP